MNQFQHPTHESSFHPLDRSTWKKYLFYTDILVWGIFGASLALVVTNIYLTGWARGEGDLAASHDHWWDTLVSLSFMVASLAWLFFRFWKNGYLALRRPF